jgi:hypothetical protein
MANILIPFGSNAVAKQTQAGAITVAPAVQQVMRELFVCYVQQGESTEDRATVLTVWARETAEHPPEIVAEALHELLRNNPRAPFRPCLKDVLDYCGRTRRKYEGHISSWYRGGKQEPPAWCKHIVRGVLAGMLRNWRENYIDLQGHAISKGESCLTDQEWAAMKVAEKIGDAIDRWPRDLLDEHGVAYGAELARIRQKIADAHAAWEAKERERKEAIDRQSKREAEANRLREEARKAASNVPDVAKAWERYWTFRHVNGKRQPDEAEKLHQEYVQLYRPALQRELSARGVREEAF